MAEPLPLTGVRVVSMALNLPGPLAAARLAAQGARVVKVEPPTGDPLAEICPAWYHELHARCEVRRIDLKAGEGRDQMRSLLGNCDLFLSSQRPSALARLGLDRAALAHLRWLNIVGEVAQPEIAGHDLTYMARAGLLRDGLPVSLFADVMGSERAFSAALLLLRQPAGSHTQVGLFDSLAPFVATSRHGLTCAGGPLGGGLPGYNVYRAREGAVAIAALEPHFRRRLYQALDLPDDSDLSVVMGTKTAAEWEAWAAERDLPVAEVKAP